MLKGSFSLLASSCCLRLLWLPDHFLKQWDGYTLKVFQFPSAKSTDFITARTS